MSYALVGQHGKATTANVTSLASDTWTPASGNHLTAVLQCTNASPSASISDGVNTWVSVGSVRSSNYTYVWYEANNVSNTSITVTGAVTAGVIRGIYIREDSGLSSTSAYLSGSLDLVAVSNPGTGANAIATSAINVSAVPSALMGFCVNEGGTSEVPTAGTGFTGRTDVWVLGNTVATPEDRRVTVAGNQTVTFTAASTGGGLTYAVMGAVFQEPGATGSTTLGGQTVASSIGTIGQAVSYALTGQTITSAEGTLTPGTAATLSGQTITSTEGMLLTGPNLGGQTITSALGTITAAVSNNATYALGGQTMALSQGQLTPQVSYLLDDTIHGIQLIGQTLTSSLGTITPTISYTVCTGLWDNSAGTLGQWTNALGTAGVWSNSTALEQLTLSQGTPTVSVSTTILGQALISLEGQISATAGNNVTVQLTGQTITSAEGVLSATASYTASAQTITSAEGTITFTLSGDQTYNLGGQTITSTLGVISLPVPIDEWLARSLLVNAGLIPIVQYNESGNVPSGYVISQSPPAGSVVPVNSPVVMVVSRGPVNLTGLVPVPTLIGLLWTDATNALQQGFLSDDKFIWQVNSAQAGTVVAQSIAAGTLVPPGTIVKLTLSAGPTIVPSTVPTPQVSPH